MTQRVEAVIFDLDGTLVDSEAPGMDVLFEEALKLGVPFTREEAHAVFRGQRMAECVAYIGARVTRPTPDFAHDFEQHFTAHIRQAMAARFREGLNPMPGAPQLLARLKVPFCIATNGPREKAELTLGLTGLLPWFEDRLFCAYDVGSFKPDPGLFLHAARALGAAPERCIVVEDSVPGVVAGLAAGMQVYAVCAPHQLPAHLAAGVRFIGHLAELDPAAL